MEEENYEMPLNNAQRAKTILICFYIMAGIEVFGFVSYYMQYRLIQNASVGDVSITEIESNDQRQFVYLMLHLVILIVAAITFIMWFRRAYANLHRVGNVRLSQSEGWAAGAWFVPFLNFVRPFVIMKEIWDETQEYNNDDEYTKSSDMVGWWWGAWLLANLSSTVISRVTDVTTLDGLTMNTQLSMIQVPFQLIAILLVILVIRNVSAFEKKMYTYFEEKQDHVDISSHLIE